MQKDMTRRICVIAILIAMQIILGRIASINIGNYLKIGFGFIPIAVCGILTGPLWTLAMAAICDIIGALLFPSGAFYFGFTLVAAVGGLLYGLFLYQKKPNLIRCLLCTFTVCLICNVVMNSFSSHRSAPWSPSEMRVSGRSCGPVFSRTWSSFPSTP